MDDWNDNRSFLGSFVVYFNFIHFIVLKFIKAVRVFMLLGKTHDRNIDICMLFKNESTSAS